MAWKGNGFTEDGCLYFVDEIGDLRRILYSQPLYIDTHFLIDFNHDKYNTNISTPFIVLGFEMSIEGD